MCLDRSHQLRDDSRKRSQYKERKHRPKYHTRNTHHQGRLQRRSLSVERHHSSRLRHFRRDLQSRSQSPITLPKSLSTPDGFDKTQLPLSADESGNYSRTVICTQISKFMNTTDVKLFFSSVGEILDIKLINLRFHSISYIKFKDIKSVSLAIGLSGHKLYNIPIIVRPHPANNTCTSHTTITRNLEQKNDESMTLYIGSLHYSIDRNSLIDILEPFGSLKCVSLIRNFIKGQTRVFGFGTYYFASDAMKAMKNLDGSKIRGRHIKVVESYMSRNIRLSQVINSGKDKEKCKDDYGIPSKTKLLGESSKDTDFSVSQVALSADDINI